MTRTLRHMMVSTWVHEYEQSDKIFHIDMGDDRVDTVISHIISSYFISISKMTISIWYIPLSIYRIQNRYTVSHNDNPIEMSLMSDLPYRYLISISDHNLSLCCSALAPGNLQLHVNHGDRTDRSHRSGIQGHQIAFAGRASNKVLDSCSQRNL